MKKLLAILLSLFLVLGLFTACNPDAVASLFTPAEEEPPAPPAPAPKGLQFTSQQDGSTIQWVATANPSAAKVSYSLDGENWIEQDLAASPEAITVNAGQTVYFKGNNDTLNLDDTNYSYLEMTGSFTGKGNPMSLIDETFTRTDIPDYAFAYLLLDCEALTDFELVIDAQTIGEYAFYDALYNVGGDVTISDIKVPTVGSWAFSYMVYTEDGDVTVGDIEVTDVGLGAYYGMLYYCGGNVTVGDITVNGNLPVCTFSDYPSFGSMLYACCCDSGIAEEQLGTITVGDITINGDAGAYAFYYFFYNCYYANINMGNLTVDGDLGEFAMTEFFHGGSYKSNAKITMGDITVGGTAEEDSFYEMFKHCNSEPYDPALIADPDKGLVEIGAMTFGNVESLAFENMIDTVSCTNTLWKFGDVTVTGTTAPGAFDNNASNFLCGVEPVNKASFKVNGEKYLAPALDTLLQFTSHQDGSTVQWIDDGSPASAVVYYSLDGVTWVDQDLSASPDAITVDEGMTVYFKGANTTLNTASAYSYFKMTGSFTGKGNPMSLIDPTFTEKNIPDYAFLYLLYGCDALTDFELIIDADNIGAHAFEYAFYSCGDMTVWGIEADTIGAHAFENAFYGCGNIAVSEIKADSVGEYAFYQFISYGTGDVTIGDIEVTTEAGCGAFSRLCHYYEGNITVGDITMDFDLGDYAAYDNISPLCMMLSYCSSDDTRAQSEHDTITVGNIHIKGDVGSYALHELFDGCYYATTVMGDLTIDGDLATEALSFFFWCNSYYSNAEVVMGDVTIGGSVAALAFDRMFTDLNYETYDSALAADPDHGKVNIGSLTIGGDVDSEAFTMLFLTCTNSEFTLGDVTVTGTVGAGAFDSSIEDNFLYGITPVNAATFKVNGVLYF